MNGNRAGRPSPMYGNERKDNSFGGNSFTERERSPVRINRDSRGGGAATGGGGRSSSDGRDPSPFGREPSRIGPRSSRPERGGPGGGGGGGRRVESDRQERKW